MAKFEITYEPTAAFQYLALEAKGAYSQIPDKITQLMELTAAQNLFPAMRGPIFAVFYTDPNEIANEDEHLSNLRKKTPSARVEMNCGILVVFESKY